MFTLEEKIEMALIEAEDEREYQLGVKENAPTWKKMLRKWGGISPKVGDTVLFIYEDEYHSEGTVVCATPDAPSIVINYNEIGVTVPITILKKCQRMGTWKAPFVF